MTKLDRIAAVNAMLEGTSIAPITLPKPKSTPKVAPVNRDRKTAMAGLKPSAGQMKRINRLHKTLGLRPYGPRQFTTVFPTMLDASNYYADLKA